MVNRMAQVSSTAQALREAQGRGSDAPAMTLEEEVLQRQREHEEKLAKQVEDINAMLVVSPERLRRQFSLP